MRARRASLRRWAALGLAAAALGGVSAAAETLDDLPAPLRRQVTEAARAYFDPAVDRWEGRKAFRAAVEALGEAGRDPLKDLDLLQSILYGGRSFEPDFTDRTWQREHGVRVIRGKDPYTTVVTEQRAFTYALASDYREPGRGGGPRPAPLPLLFVLHDEGDPGGDDGSRAGETALRRRMLRKEFRRLHESWMMLAPSAPRGAFTEPDGTVRGDLTTEVLAEFWKRHHVDFDRVVLDGSDAALAMAAAQPVFFAGLVLRGGTPDPATVAHFANVPVYVVGDEALQRALVAAGHPEVTGGEEAGLPAWLDARRRTWPARLRWTVARPDQLLPWWISVEEVDPSVSAPTLEAAIDRAAGRIEVRTHGIRRITCFLNDRLVDLDRDVLLDVDGREIGPRRLPRDFDATLDRDPIRIRRSLYLGWLFPAVLTGIACGETAGSAAPDRPEPPGGSPVERQAAALALRAAEREAAGDLPAALRLHEELAALGETSRRSASEARAREIGARLRDREGPARELVFGRPEAVAALRVSADPEQRYLAALVALWWRPDPAGDPEAYREVAEAATGLMGERWRWLLAGGRGSYPTASAGVADPHPVVTALVQDRIRRETEGREGVARDGPLTRLRDDPAYGPTVRWFLDQVLGPAYRGPEPDPDSAAAAVYRQARPRGRWLAALGLLGLLAASGLAAYLLRRPRAPASPPRA